MNSERIKELRSQIPIGIAEAKQLLESTEYDVSLAKQLWQKQEIEHLADQLSISQQEAEELLHEVNFDSIQANEHYKNNNKLLIDRILESSKFNMDVIKNLLSNFDLVKRDGLDYFTGNWEGRDKTLSFSPKIQELIKMLTWFDSSGWSYDDFNNEVIPILREKLGSPEFFDDLIWSKENEREGYEVLKMSSKLNPFNMIRYQRFKSNFNQQVKQLEEQLIDYIRTNKLEVEQALNSLKKS